MKLKRILKLLFSLALFGISCIIAIQVVVINNTERRILSLEEVADLSDIDCILVLGAGIDKNNKPSLMLKERLDTSIDIYNTHVTDKIIMSGDHTRNNHDEVNVMKKYAMDNNDIVSSNIFMDHAGVSTYDSLYRAKNIFGVKKMIIVTQGYHLYRALYIAESLGIEAYGVDATKKVYAGQKMRDIREVAARCKDFLKSIIKPKSSFLGDKISLADDGNITNDYYIIIKNNSNEYVDFSKDKYDSLTKIIDAYNFTKTDCEKKDAYTLSINTEIYGIEILEEDIHIAKNDREIVLNQNDSKVVLELLGEIK